MKTFAGLPQTPEEKAKEELFLKKIADNYQTSAPPFEYEASTTDVEQDNFSYADEDSTTAEPERDEKQ